MSYNLFRQRCAECGAIWNAAFGMVATTLIASPPGECPHCGAGEIAYAGPLGDVENGPGFHPLTGNPVPDPA